MPTLNPIVPFVEARDYLNVSTASSDERLLNLVKRHVEHLARNYVGWGISQPRDTASDPHVEYHPLGHRSVREGATSDEVDVVNDKAVFSNLGGEPDVIQLRQKFVRNDSTLEVREDEDADFDQGTSDFPSSSVLTQGTDYVLEVDEPNLSKSGRLSRLVSNWPAKPGTVKVTFNAGLTATELDEQYPDIKLVLMEEIAMQFRESKARQGVGHGVGPVVRESVSGEFSRTYDNRMSLDRARNQLSLRTQRQLQPYRLLPLLT